MPACMQEVNTQSARRATLCLKTGFSRLLITDTKADTGFKADELQVIGPCAFEIDTKLATTIYLGLFNKLNSRGGDHDRERKE